MLCRRDGLSTHCSGVWLIVGSRWRRSQRAPPRTTVPIPAHTISRIRRDRLSGDSGLGSGGGEATPISSPPAWAGKRPEVGGDCSCGWIVEGAVGAGDTNVTDVVSGGTSMVVSGRSTGCAGADVVDVVVAAAVVDRVGDEEEAGPATERAAVTAAGKLCSTSAKAWSPGQVVLDMVRWPVMVGVTTNFPSGWRFDPRETNSTVDPGRGSIL